MTELSSRPAARWAYRSVGELAQSLLKKESSALELTDQIGVGRTRDDMRTASHCHSNRGYGRFAHWRPDHWPGIRRPDAAGFRPPHRARIRRLHTAAGLRIRGIKIAGRPCEWRPLLHSLDPLRRGRVASCSSSPTPDRWPAPLLSALRLRPQTPRVFGAAWIKR
jgi:hypothetical protein